MDILKLYYNIWFLLQLGKDVRLHNTRYFGLVLVSVSFDSDNHTGGWINRPLYNLLETPKPDIHKSYVPYQILYHGA